MNKELLIRLIEVQSSFVEDTAINSFIETMLSNITGVSINKDRYGNIYATKGLGKSGYKCIVSHTDTVHRIVDNKKAFISNGILYSMSVEENLQYKSNVMKQVGTGGDDRCGIYTCIEALKDFDDIKAVFFRFEETGCKGSSNSDISFFSDCNFIIQCDRKGNSDFITRTNGIAVASSEFEASMAPLFESKGYSIEVGSSTDVGALKKMGVAVSCVNLSSGYYNAHTDSETINLSDLQNCYDLVTEMFSLFGDRRFEHIHIPVVVQYSSNVKNKKSMFKLPIGQVDSFDVFNETPASMVNIPGTKKYRLIFNEFIYYDNKINCPVCGETIEMSFFTDAAMFFCNEDAHSSYIVDKKMHKDIKINLDGITFVYDMLYDVWYKEFDATYDNSTNSYKLKKFNFK